MSAFPPPPTFQPPLTALPLPTYKALSIPPTFSNPLPLHTQDQVVKDLIQENKELKVSLEEEKWFVEELKKESRLNDRELKIDK